MSETIYISYANKRWKTHTDKKAIGELFILKSAAIGAAVNYVTKLPEGSCATIKVQDRCGQFFTYWDLHLDAYPPCKKSYVRFKTATNLSEKFEQ